MRTIALSVALVVYSALVSFLAPTWLYIVVNPVVAITVVALVYRSGASREDLGMATLWSPRVRNIALVSALVGILIVAGAIAFPALAKKLAEQGTDAPTTIGGLLCAVLLRIPVATAASEELIFRSGVFASFRNRHGLFVAVAGSSFFYALWHVGPSIANSDDGFTLGDVLTTDALRVAVPSVVGTFLLGLLFAFLRLRSDSVVAPAIAHAALNCSLMIAGFLIAT